MSDRTEKHEGESECAVEEFSDDILVRILSLLSLKEAAATSILSTRWRYLWRFAKLSLNFEFDACPSSMELTDYSNEKKKSFINWVNTVVDQHSGEIDLFRVKYRLNNSDRISINKWVKFALRNRSLIELDLYLFIWAELSRYKLPRKLFSDDQHVGLKSLKVLHLNSVSVSGKHIHDLLSNAPVLERLSVENSPKLVQLRVSGQSLALKHLTIRGCSKLINLEICGVNLVSLYFEQITKFSKFILRDVPMLVDLYCNSDSAREFFRMFSCCVSQLEVLRMVDSSRFWMFRKDSIHDASYPHIPNIKHLHLKLYIEDHGQEDGGLSNLLLLMEAFPNLQKLVLHVPRHNSYWQKRKIHLQKSKIRLRKYMSRGPRSPHECLKEVEILGYNAFGDHIERITYLIKHCFALEKIVINCKYSNRDLTLLKKEKILEHEELARTHAMIQLKTHIPSNIEFVCL